MNYIQYMKPGGNFGDKLKTGIKKFLKAAGEASRMAKDARINNPGAAMIRDAYAKGDEELAKLLTDEMQAANLTGIALGSGAAPLITGFTVAPVTTGVTLATGMAGGMAGMYGTDKAINYFSDGKYTGWGNWINQATNGAIGENTAGFFHPGAIFGGLTTGKIGNKIVGLTNRGKLELLNSALNNNIQATTLQPTVADEAVLRGQLGWAPKQTIYYRHGSLDPELKTFVPKHDRWDVVTHGADPNMYFVTDLSTPVSAANMMDLRPYQYTGNIVAEKPMVQVGDFNVAGKNATRNQLIARARQQGADTYLLQDIVDNKVPHLNIVARFIGPEGEAVQGGALLQTKTTPTKTSLAFFERLPVKISEAERLGIPKGERNAYLIGTNADPSYYTAIGLNNSRYTQRLRDFHFELSFPGIERTTVYHGNMIPDNMMQLRGLSPYFDGGRLFGYFSSSSYPIAKTYNFVNGAPTYSLYPIIKKPYVLQANGRNGIAVDTNKFNLAVKTDLVVKQAFDAGHDGVIIKDVVDIGPMRDNLKNASEVADDIITLPGKAKMTDAITYDDLYQIIPLSQRDNILMHDIRYKQGGSIKIEKKNKGKFAKVRDYVDYKNNK